MVCNCNLSTRPMLKSAAGLVLVIVVAESPAAAVLGKY
jgi:hypothetical protein